MKKIFLLLLFSISLLLSKAQTFPINQGFGSTTTLTKFNGGAIAGVGFIDTYYFDTTAANANPYIKNYRFARIGTADGSTWYRSVDVKKWILSSTSSGTANITNIYNNSITTYALIDGDSCVVPTTGGGLAIDTICFNFVVCTVRFLNDSSFLACSCDSVPICDTGHFKKTPLYIFQNGLTQYGAGIVGQGGRLDTNTHIYLNGRTFSYDIYSNSPGSGILKVAGAQVYAYTFLSQNLSTDGTPVTRLTGGELVFLGDGVMSAYQQPMVYKRRYPFVNGSTGFKFTNDTLNTAGLDSADYIIADYMLRGWPNNVETSKFKIYGNGKLNASAYPHTRNDGVVNKALSTDANGNVILGTINGVTGCGLFTPGTVFWDSLLVFTVSPSSYALCCDSISRTSALVHITLGAADPSFGRFDAIALDSTGVVVVPGTASSAPALPQLDACQILLTYIFIPAGSTVPGDGGNGCGIPATTIIYDQHTGGEYTPANGNTVVLPDFDNTANPAHLTKATYVASFTNFKVFWYTAPASIAPSNYSSLKLFLKLNATFNPNTYLALQWYDTITNTGSTVYLQNGQYGFSRTNSSTYQEILIPMTAWTAIPSTVNRFTILMVGSNGSGFYLDYIQLQSGVCQPTTGNGTLTGLGVGNLLPLFTSTVNLSNPAVPVIGFNLSNAAANTVFGNPNGTTGQPSYYAASSLFSVNNGLVKNSSGVAGLDSNGVNPLTRNVLINTTSGFHFDITGSKSDYTLQVTNSGTGNGVTITGNTSGYGLYSTGATGVQGNSANGFAVIGNATVAGTGILGDAVSGQAGYFRINPSSTNTTATIATFQRLTQGTAAANIAGQIELSNETTDGSATTSNTFISGWTTPTTGAEVSKFIITGKNAGSTQNQLTLGSAGQLTLDQYTTSNFNGGSANDSVVVITSAGVVLKRNASSFGGISLGRNGITDSVDRFILGGDLYKNTTINTAGFTTTITGANTITLLDVIGTSSGTAIKGTSLNGFGVSAIRSVAFTNSTADALDVRAITSGTPAAGFGSSISFAASTTSGTSVLGRFVLEWADATTATRTSKASFILTNSGSSGTVFTLNANKSIQLTTITATEASAITPAEGMMLFVRDTDATFITVGFWGYQGGVWLKL